MDESSVWSAVDQERSTLADLFEGLPDEAWGVPSLCDAWTVRDVLAHLTLAHAKPLWFMTSMVRARFDFDRCVRDTATRQAARSTEEMIGVLRGMVGSRRKAPGISCREPLTDVLVHGQDVAVPLGLQRVMPVEPALEALRRVLTAPKVFAFPAREPYREMTLVVTDAGVEIGSGPRLEATAQELLLAATGRQALVPS